MVLNLPKDPDPIIKGLVSIQSVGLDWVITGDIKTNSGAKFESSLGDRGLLSATASSKLNNPLQG